MIYEVFVDEKPLFYPNDEEAVIYNSKLEEALNDAGTFTCTVPKSNPLFDEIYPRVSMVQILRDGKEIWCGQVRRYEEEFEGEKELSCVGELAFLYDSVQPQDRFQNQTPAQFFNHLLAVHNSKVEDNKKFEPGIVTVTDPNNSIYRYTNYEDTLSAMRNKLCDSLNGYLRVRKSNGKRYLDLVRLEDYGKYCDQPIKMGYNMLDYVKKNSGETIYTVLIPLGARLEESEVDGLDAYTNIKSVNNGKDYIYNEEAVKHFGMIWTTKKWDDVTEPANLKRKGEQWLETTQYETVSLELTAVDMSMLNQKLDKFDLGDTIRAVAKPFGLDVTYPVQKKTTYLQEPEKNTITLGNTAASKSYTKQVQASISDIEQSMPQEKTILQLAREKASQLIQSASEGNIYTVYDENNKPKELLIMDQPDINTTQKVWRWNMNGFGYSNTGYNGEYGTAITMDGEIVGERITANSITGEQLSVNYKNALSDSIDGAVTTKFNAANEAISGEVERAKKAEKTLSEDVTKINEDAKTFKSTVEGTFRDGIITEAEAYSIERYIAIMNNDMNSAKKRFSTMVSSALQVSTGTGDNMSIKFNKSCATETSGSKNWDYVSVYYKKDGKTYIALNSVNGAAIADKTYVLPSTDIYVYWHSDSTNCNYYGFSIDSMQQTTAQADTTGTESTLPNFNSIETYDSTIICTPHPYSNSMDRLWHYKARKMTRDELTNRYNAYISAYNNLIETIQSVVSDREITEDEKAEVDAKFITYNDTFASLNEGLSEAGVDTAAISAYGVVDYAKARIKILSDRIELKVEKNDVESIIEQKADSIRLKADKISWSSTYSSMTEDGKLTCQSANLTDVNATGTITTVNDKQKVEMYNGRLRVKYNDKELGLIGGNGYAQSNNIEGLNFDLEMTGDYMTWAAQENANDHYMMKWTYARSSFGGFRGDALNAGCDIDMQNYKLYNVSWPDGGITGTLNFVQIKSMSTNSNGEYDGTAQSWNTCTMQFKNGILIKGSWG